MDVGSNTNKQSSSGSVPMVIRYLVTSLVKLCVDASVYARARPRHGEGDGSTPLGEWEKVTV
ncbi:hypothetical protein SARC_17624, partial [Sphaeroforma arctica JP610]